MSWPIVSAGAQAVQKALTAMAECQTLFAGVSHSKILAVTNNNQLQAQPSYSATLAAQSRSC
jgi:hypothetical protein